MPIRAQQGRRSHDSRRTSSRGSRRDERRERQPVLWLQPRTTHLPARHRQFMPQHQQCDVYRRLPAPANDHQIEQHPQGRYRTEKSTPTIMPNEGLGGRAEVFEPTRGIPHKIAMIPRPESAFGARFEHDRTCTPGLRDHHSRRRKRHRMGATLLWLRSAPHPAVAAKWSNRLWIPAGPRPVAWLRSRPCDRAACLPRPCSFAPCAEQVRRCAEHVTDPAMGRLGHHADLDLVQGATDLHPKVPVGV
jgi:hypothetical protein